MSRPTPPCSVCRAPVDRLQRSEPGDRPKRSPVIAYPCQCWLTPSQAQHVANEARRLFRLGQP